jgi:hypothetical protein
MCNPRPRTILTQINVHQMFLLELIQAFTFENGCRDVFCSPKFWIAVDHYPSNLKNFQWTWRRDVTELARMGVFQIKNSHGVQYNTSSQSCMSQVLRPRPIWAFCLWCVPIFTVSVASLLNSLAPFCHCLCIKQFFEEQSIQTQGLFKDQEDESNFF